MQHTFRVSHIAKIFIRKVLFILINKRNNKRVIQILIVMILDNLEKSKNI